MGDRDYTVDQGSSSEIIVRKNYDVQLRDFEEGLLSFLAQLNLPTTSILVSVNERIRVFNNIEYVVSLLEYEKKTNSVYISKFIAAVASGLFDAALNYLWNETILELRRRVAQYDIAYFYTNAVRGEKRKGLNNIEDLVKVDDSELVHGAKEIGLISELGFRHLDYVRYMRNWTSAAHPNQNELTGIKLLR